MNAFVSELLHTLVAHAYEFRDPPFTLASGGTSNHYVDCKRVLLDPMSRLQAGHEILRRMAHLEVPPSAVAGVALGGIPLADTVSMQTGLPAIYVRPEAKAHGTGNRVEVPFTLPQHQSGIPVSVLLLEDVTTSGESSLRAVRALREADLYVYEVVTLVDREQGAKDTLGDEGVRLWSCFTLNAIVAVAAAQKLGPIARTLDK